MEFSWKYDKRRSNGCLCWWNEAGMFPPLWRQNSVIMFEIPAIWFLAVYGFEPNITIVDMCCCIWCVDPGGHAHDWRGGGVLTRPRPVLRADWGEEKDLADIRPEHRWGFLFTSCNSSTVHSICLWCQKQHAELNLFYNLPLVRCSARLTIFARQLEGKYITLSIFDFWWHSLIFVWCCSLGAFSVFLAVMSCLLWYRTCGRAHSRNLLLSEIRLLYDSVKPKFKFVLS